MEMSRDQLNAFYLVLNRKEITKRELVNLGYKGATLSSLCRKGLLQTAVVNGGVVYRLTQRSFVFESQLLMLEAKHPNVRQEGAGTYMVRLAKMVTI